jgi:DNA-binding transcriptional MerR regulator
MPDKNKLYNHREVKAVYPILRDRTLISWAEDGLISSLPPSGRGTQRKYTLQSLVDIGVVLALTKAGIKRWKIKELMEVVDA